MKPLSSILPANSDVSSLSSSSCTVGGGPLVDESWERIAMKVLANSTILSIVVNFIDAQLIGFPLDFFLQILSTDPSRRR